MNKISKTDAQWRQALDPETYRVAREHGTERPGSHPYNQEKRAGEYDCACCGNALFPSDTKYESGSGWPSFYAPVSDTAVSEKQDRSSGMARTEVLCARCDAHLGHVFPDGPAPTGQRFCMNGAALAFKPKSDT